jgi:hypothetical protein
MGALPLSQASAIDERGVVVAHGPMQRRGPVWFGDIRIDALAEQSNGCCRVTGLDRLNQALIFDDCLGRVRRACQRDRDDQRCEKRSPHV